MNQNQNPYEQSSYPQQSYGYPGQAFVPPPEPPKKSRKGWWIAGIVAALLLGASIGASGMDEEDTQAASAPATQTSEPEEMTEVETEEPEADPVTDEPVEETEPEPEPEPDPQPVEDDVDERVPFSGDLTYDESMMLMEMIWPETSAEDRENICWGYNFMGSGWAYDTFEEGFGDEMSLNRAAFDDFFEEQC